MPTLKDFINKEKYKARLRKDLAKSTNDELIILNEELKRILKRRKLKQ